MLSLWVRAALVGPVIHFVPNNRAALQLHWHVVRTPNDLVLRHAPQFIEVFRGRRLTVPILLRVTSVNALQHYSVLLLHPVATVRSAVLATPVWWVNARKFKFAIADMLHHFHAICVYQQNVTASIMRRKQRLQPVLNIAHFNIAPIPLVQIDSFE